MGSPGISPPVTRAPGHRPPYPRLDQVAYQTSCPAQALPPAGTSAQLRRLRVLPSGQPLVLPSQPS